MSMRDLAPGKDEEEENPEGLLPVGNFISSLRSMETTHRPVTMLRCKLVLVGDATVGKTALTQMFHSGGQSYPKNYIMTVGVDFVAKMVQIPGTNTWVEFYLFDCAGHSIFNQRNLNSRHWENASYVAVVYDIGSRESFQSCGKWLQGVRATRPSSSAPLAGVLIANKADFRQTSRAVLSRQEGEEFAKQNGLKYFETSAATNTDVDAPFNFIAMQFYNRYEEAIRKTESLAGR